MGHYTLFLLMSTLLVILPGPDTGLTTQNTVVNGRKGGIHTVLGISSGLAFHTLAAVFGLSAIIAKSALLFSIFKYVGAIYLIYLGVKSLLAIRHKETATDNELTNETSHKGKSCFRQGFLTNVLNPKVAVFFLTFLPQFVDTQSSMLLQFSLMGLSYIVITLIWLLLYVLLIDSISVWIKKPSVQRSIQGISGLVLFGFGVKLALEKNP